MKHLRLYSFLSLLLGCTTIIAQHKIRCKETGFYQKPLKICFASCVKTLLEEQCSKELKGFYGSLEFKLVISIEKERILNTHLLIHDKNEPLNSKQRISLKKALKNIPLTFIGKADNQRLALPSYLYRTSWVYGVEDGHFKGL